MLSIKFTILCLFYFSVIRRRHAVNFFEKIESRIKRKSFQYNSVRIFQQKGFLDKQIEIIQPIIISPLRNFACSYIFEKFGLNYDKIGSVHGRIFSVNTLLGKIHIIPLYHPAVATYNPNTKKMLLEDFKLINRILSEF